MNKTVYEGFEEGLYIEENFTKFITGLQFKLRMREPNLKVDEKKFNSSRLFSIPSYGINIQYYKTEEGIKVDLFCTTHLRKKEFAKIEKIIQDEELEQRPTEDVSPTEDITADL